MGFGRCIAGETESSSSRFLMLFFCGIGGEEFSGMVTCCGAPGCVAWLACIGGVILFCEV
jgi:hypothetical protein